MSILAIALETFETTCKNTVVTDMLTNMSFKKKKLLLTFLNGSGGGWFVDPQKTDIYLEMVTKLSFYTIYYHFNMLGEP
jgi:hypothetical protein